MKSFRRIISMILVIAIFANISLTGLAEAAGGERKSSGDVFSFAQEITWAEAGKQIAGMLSFIVEDAANIDLEAYSDRITHLPSSMVTSSNLGTCSPASSTYA